MKLRSFMKVDPSATSRVPCFRGWIATNERLQSDRESMKHLQCRHAFAVILHAARFCSVAAKAWHPNPPQSLGNRLLIAKLECEVGLDGFLVHLGGRAAHDDRSFLHDIITVRQL